LQLFDPENSVPFLISTVFKTGAGDIVMGCLQFCGIFLEKKKRRPNGCFSQRIDAQNRRFTTAAPFFNCLLREFESRQLLKKPHLHLQFDC
jgi:hypothetical protein